jgi:hypothetical protein
MADIDLLSLFGNAAKTLQDNQDVLNQADDWNGDHGDNMVEIFNLVTGAIKENSDSSASEQLAQAGKALASKKSGSAQVYSNGFAQAAEAIQGKDVTPDNLINLVQSLMGAGGQTQDEDNPLGGLLGGLFGDDQSAQDDKLDLGDIINTGFDFVKSKNEGQDTISALVSSIMGNASLGESSHRSQSGELVASSLLNSLLDK